MGRPLESILVPSGAAAVGVTLIALWIGAGPSVHLLARVPGLDGVPILMPAKAAVRPVPGEPVRSAGRPSSIIGQWPCFRGPDHDAINKEPVRLARHWPSGGPRRLWSVELGEGYAAAAVSGGRVYVLDHVSDQPPDGADVMRCLSLDDGKELWHNSYPVSVPPHHGMSRTIPAVAGKWVVSLGPQCQVVCWDADSGKAHWLIDLVLDYGATVPPWYAGQCPLIDAVDRPPDPRAGRQGAASGRRLPLGQGPLGESEPARLGDDPRRRSRRWNRPVGECTSIAARAGWPASRPRTVRSFGKRPTGKSPRRPAPRR